MMRWIATTIAVLAACTAPPHGDDANWRILDVAQDVHFQGAIGLGEEIWAFGESGPRDGIYPRQIHFDGQEWLEDTEGAPLTALAGSSAGDSGGRPTRIPSYESDPFERLWRYAADDHPIRWTDAWGAGPEEIWVTAEVDADDPTRVYRWDGVAWSTVESVRDVGEFSGFLTYERGCRGEAGRQWIATNRIDGVPFPNILTGSATVWSLLNWHPTVFLPLQDVGGSVRALACVGASIWAIVDVEDSAVSDLVAIWDGTRWKGALSLEQTGSGVLQVSALWTEDADNGWIVGAEDVDGRMEPRVWRVTDGAAGLVPLEGLELPSFPPTTSDDYSVLRAVWQTASGRVFVFGVDGIVLELAE